MKHLIFVWLLSNWVLALGQDIQGIVENDPFDPARGKVEEEVAEDEKVIPIDLPVLDGTIIIGDKKMAVFTVVLEGKPSSARVSLNGKVAQYTVTGIERHKVQLTSGAGEPIDVALYSGKKEQRGGTKQIALPKPKEPVTKGKKGKDGKPEGEKAPPDPTKRDPALTNAKPADKKEEAKPVLPRKPPRQPRGADAGSDPTKRF